MAAALRVLVLLGAVLGAAAAVRAASCAAYGDCDACVADAACGWCPSTGACLAAAANATCQATAFDGQFTLGECAHLAARSCYDCHAAPVAEGFALGWCPDAHRCYYGSPDGPSDNLTCTASLAFGAWTFETRDCACVAADSCAACTAATAAQQASCGWCPAANSCLRGNATGPDSGLVCPMDERLGVWTTQPVMCACLSQSDCESCMRGPECSWCASDQTCHEGRFVAPHTAAAAAAAAAAPSSHMRAQVPVPVTTPSAAAAARLAPPLPTQCPNDFWVAFTGGCATLTCAESGAFRCQCCDDPTGAKCANNASYCQPPCGCATGAGAALGALPACRGCSADGCCDASCRAGCTPQGELGIDSCAFYTASTPDPEDEDPAVWLGADFLLQSYGAAAVCACSGNGRREWLTPSAACVRTYLHEHHVALPNDVKRGMRALQNSHIEFAAKYTNLIYGMHKDAYAACCCPGAPAPLIDWYGIMFGGKLLSCGLIVDAIEEFGRCQCDGW